MLPPMDVKESKISPMIQSNPPSNSLRRGGSRKEDPNSGRRRMRTKVRRVNLLKSFLTHMCFQNLSFSKQARRSPGRESTFSTLGFLVLHRYFPAKGFGCSRKRGRRSKLKTKFSTYLQISMSFPSGHLTLLRILRTPNAARRPPRKPQPSLNLQTQRVSQSTCSTTTLTMPTTRGESARK